MRLLDEIDLKKKEISTDGYPMSIGELISLYKEGGVDVHPEFQRFFRWSILQKSKLIESILLGIPIPSIFVSQRKDGVWDVVDGQQRLSTLFEFIGILKDEDGNLLPPSELVETKYLPSLAGMKWDNENDDQKQFSQDLKFIFKREKIDVKIVKRESDENIKYELFQRLNTLGSKLSDQEVRNCILVMLNISFYRWLNKLSLNPSFVEVTSLTDRLIDEQFNMELALRFIVLKNVDLNEMKSIQDLGEFLTEKMISIATDPTFDMSKEEETFNRTFEILQYSAGGNSLKRYNSTKDKFEGGFVISAFESVAIGLGRNINLWNEVQLNSEVQDRIVNKIKEIWLDATYQLRSGSGVNVTRRAPAIIPIGQRVMTP